MSTVELRLTLDQEVSTMPEDETLLKKAIASLRRLKERASAAKVEDHEPTHEEMLVAIKQGLQAIKDRKDGKDVTGVFRDAREVLNEL